MKRKRFITAMALFLSTALSCAAYAEQPEPKTVGNPTTVSAQSKQSPITYIKYAYRRSVFSGVDDFSGPSYANETQSNAIITFGVITFGGQALTINGEELTAWPSEADQLTAYSNGIITFRGKNSLTGFTDTTASYYIPPVFQSAGFFNQQDYTFVSLDDGSYYLMNRKGEYVQNKAYAKITQSRHGFIVTEKATGKNKLLDNQLNEIFSGFDTIESDIPGYLIYKSNGKYGLYSTNSATIAAAPDYKKIASAESAVNPDLFVFTDSDGSYFYDAAAKKRYAYFGNKWNDNFHVLRNNVSRHIIFSAEDGGFSQSLIDIDGKALYTADEIEDAAPNYYIIKKANPNKQDSYYYGIIDRSGKVLAEPKNTGIFYLTDDIFYICTETENHLWNIKTNQITDLKYKVNNTVKFKSKDKTYAYMEYTTADGKSGILDKTGKLVFEGSYDSITAVPRSFDYDLWRRKNDDVYNLENWSEEFGDIKNYMLLCASKDSKKLLIDLNGNIVSDTAYDEISHGGKSIFVATLGEERYLLFRNDPLMQLTKPSVALSEKSSFVLPEITAPTIVFNTTKDYIIYNGKPMMQTAGKQIGSYFYADPHINYFDESNGSYESGNIYTSYGSVADVYFGLQSLAFTENSDEAIYSVYNTETRQYDKITIKMKEPYVQYKKCYPIEVIAEAFGLSFYQDAKNELYVLSQTTAPLSPEKAKEYKALLDSAVHISELPREDGSTATEPFTKALYSHLTKVDESNIGLYHSKTYQAYMYLIFKERDILFVADAPIDKETENYAHTAGITLESTPFAKDGFIFFVNKNNPVDSLTIEQIQDIYTGKITNWKELGGDDVAILAYQRNEDSGSQAIMNQLIMHNKKMMEPIKGTEISAMGAIIESVAEYEDSSAAIGFSLFHYATEMHANSNVKLISIEGVKPSTENIADNSYPLIFTQNAVIRSDSPANSAERKMVDFVLSDEGRKIILQSGLIPIK